MNSRLNLNTVILLLILVVLIVGGYVFLSTLRRLTQPLEKVEQSLEEQFSKITEPTPTIIPNPVTIIHEVANLSRLETASYTIEKVITAESRQGPLGFLLGDRLILIAHGQVIAGVDLSDLSPDAIVTTEDGTVIMVLPPAEVFVATLDNKKSYVFDRSTGVIGMNPGLETSARQAAEEEILAAALEDGILEKAQENAEMVLRNLVLGLGFEKVVFAKSIFIESPEMRVAGTPTAAP
jgi:hypothetical protein